MTSSRKRRRRHRHVRPGTPPGTIVIDKDSPPPVIEVIQYDRKELTRQHDIAVSAIPQLADDKVTWIDIVGLGDKAVIQQVASRFELHRLAVEDVVNTHQRPKLERFKDHLYIVLQMPKQDEELELEQVSLFVGKNFVLTWQERSGDCFAPIRDRLRSTSGMLRGRGNGFLAYALMDAIIDAYFPLMIQYSDELDNMEDLLTDVSAQYLLLQQLHHLRGDIRNLRRTVWSHRDVLANLISFEAEFLDEETRLHLRDVADHTLRLVEMMESHRDSCSDLQDLYLSTVSMKTNEVMKVLTIIATIFIPLGFIAGLYGMNFSTTASPWNMPETQWYYGYPMAIAIMVLVATGMLAYFRRLGWLGP